MSAPKHAQLTKYSDGLIDPALRIVGTHKGVEWVTDRYVMVRTDMFRRAVTPASPKTEQWPPIKDRSYRSILGGVPRERFDGTLHRLTLDADDGRRIGFAGTAEVVLFDDSVRPLLLACDYRKIHNGRIVGFQKRPHSSSPVLVCVVMGIRAHQLDSVERITERGAA